MDKAFPLYGDLMVDHLIEDFFLESEAGQRYFDLCDQKQWPFIIDHITIRCFNIDRRAEPFLKIGYVYQDEAIEYPDQGWWAKVYRKEGFPALFIDQAYDDERGQSAIIPGWVKKFGEELLHHVAVLVPDIESVVDTMKHEGVLFSGEIAGARGTRLRQIFTSAEVRAGSAFSVLELTERNNYSGFYPEQANRLMESSVKTKAS
ncbi:MAG: hypothetical protein AAB035_03850 [Nitrospirota bacterium]